MRKTLPHWLTRILALALACAPACVFGQAQVLGLASFSHEMTFVDMTNGEVLSTNPLLDNVPDPDSIDGYNAMARFPGTNTFYAVARLSNNGRRLATLDPSTKTVTLVDPTFNQPSMGGIAAMAFNGDGSTLFVSSGQGGGQPHQLSTVNITNGALTSYCSIDDASLSDASPGIAWHPETGMLYRVTYDGSSGETRLWQIDVSTTACTMTSITVTGIPNYTSSMTWSPVLDKFVVNVQGNTSGGWYTLDRLTGVGERIITSDVQHRGAAALDAPVVPLCQLGGPNSDLCGPFCLIGVGDPNGPSDSGNIENLSEFASEGGIDVCSDTFGVTPPPLHTDIWPPAGWSPVVPGIFPGTTFLKLNDFDFGTGFGRVLNENWDSQPSIPGYLSAAAPTGLFDPSVAQPRSARIIRFNRKTTAGDRLIGPLRFARYGSEDVRVTVSDFTDQTQLVTTVLSGDGERVWREDTVAIPGLPSGPFTDNDIQFEIEYLGSGSDNGFFIDSIQVDGQISFLKEPGFGLDERDVASNNPFAQSLFQLGSAGQGGFDGTSASDEFTLNGRRQRVAYLGYDPLKDANTPEAAGVFGGREGDLRVQFNLAQDYDEVWLVIASFGSSNADVLVDGQVISTIEASNPARHSSHNLKLGPLTQGTHVITLQSQGTRYLDFLEVIDRGTEEPALEAAPEAPKLRRRTRSRNRLSTSIRRSNSNSCKLSLFGSKRKASLGTLLSSFTTNRRNARIKGNTRGQKVRFVSVVEECAGKLPARSKAKRIRRTRR